MNTTLVNAPYYLRGLTSFHYIEGYTIPLGILSLAAVVQRDLPEHSIQIVDGMAEGLGPSQLIDRILQTEPDLVGISSFTYSVNDALLLAQWIKRLRPHIKIMLGGIHVSLFPMDLMREHNAIDCIIRGEAEYAFRDFLAGKPLDQIKGLVYRDKDGEIRMHPESATVEDIDELPIIAHDLVDMSRYFPTAGQCRRFPVGTMITSRGCPGSCTFCSSSICGKRVRLRSVENIMKEIRLLMNRYGVREIVFMDDVFTFNRKRVEALCHAIQEEKLDLLWDCSTRAQFVDKPLLELMKRSGCNQLSFGVESGDERVLKDIKKGQKLDDIREKIAMAKEIGLESRGSFILGFPSDTLESMQRTIDFAIELDPHLVSFYIASPYPGTEMYEWAVSNDMLMVKNWSSYDQSHHIMKIPNVSTDEVDMMYRRAYQSFYHRWRFIFRRLGMLRSWYDIKNAFKAMIMTVKVHAKLEKNYDEIEAEVNRLYAQAAPSKKQDDLSHSRPSLAQ